MALRNLARLKLINQILSKSIHPLSCAGSKNFCVLSTKNQNLLSSSNENFSIINIRSKYDKSGKTSGAAAENQDDDSDEEDNEFASDMDKKNIVKYKLQSMRADLILKSALNIARNKIEVAFYENRIRINEKKISKKSVSVEVGSYIDLVKNESPTNSDHLVVSRVEVLGVKANEDSITVTMKRFKNLTIEKYKDY